MQRVMCVEVECLPSYSSERNREARVVTLRTGQSSPRLRSGTEDTRNCPGGVSHPIAAPDGVSDGSSRTS